jgi:hypothetical protein
MTQGRDTASAERTAEMRRATGRAAAALAAAVAAALALAGTATAATPHWTCRASAVTASVAGMSTLDPIVVDTGPCQPGSAGLPNVTDALGLAPALEARTAYATSSTTPDGALPVDTTVGTTAGVEGLHLRSGDGTIVIGVDVAQSSASATCKDGTPSYTGASTVAGLTINGQPVILDQVLQPLTDGISGSPLGGLLWVKLNEQIKDANGLTQNAAHVKVLQAAGDKPLVDVVIAQSKVTAAGAACDRSQQDGSGGGGNGGNGGGNPGVSGSGVPNGTNGGCGRLKMYFTRNHKRKLSVRYGKRQVTRGRIVSCKGKSIVGAKIDVYNIVNGKKHKLVKTGLRSRPGGKLTLILPLNLTTRTIIYEYRGNLKSKKVNSRQTLRLTVRDRHGKILRGPGPGYKRGR